MRWRQEAASPSTFPVSAPGAAAVADPEPPAAEPAPHAVGAADPVGRAALSKSTRLASPVRATPVANTGEQAVAGSDGLLWPALAVLVLILLYAGARLLLGPVELDVFRSGPFRRRGYPRA